MGDTTVLQLPFMGGLDQKTSRFYLDPNGRQFRQNRRGG
jgi:hypothetical protein